MMRNIVRYGFLTILLIGIQTSPAAAQSIPISDEDAQIISLVLSHFGTRKDASFFSDDGLLLVSHRPPTASIGRGDERHFGYGKKCKPSYQAIDDVARRLKEDATYSEGFPKGPAWQLMSPEESKLQDESFWLQKVNGRMPKTMLWISPPGYSKSGVQALVVLDFRWSIHGAKAIYTLKKDKNLWSITCSALVHFM